MAIVTLTTDWGNDGVYTGAFRGLLFSLSPETRVVDISNSIRPFDIGQASFVLSQAFFYFPKGTIHIMGVAPVQHDKSMHRFVAIESNGHFFIGQNSGVWELIFGESDFTLHEIAIAPQNFLHTGFPELEVFAKATTSIAKKQTIDFLGKKLPSSALTRKMPVLPKFSPDEILGHTVFFDNFGNAITNITSQDIETVGNRRPFEILVRNAKHTIYSISKSYDEKRPGQALAIYSFSGFIEIAIANGNAKDVLNLDTNSEILVRFKAMPAQRTLFDE